MSSINENTSYAVTRYMLKSINTKTKSKYTRVSRPVSSRDRPHEQTSSLKSWQQSDVQQMQKVKRIKQLYKKRLSFNAMRTLQAHHRFKYFLHKKKKFIAIILKQTHRDLMKTTMSDVKKVWKLAKWIKNRETSFQVFISILQRSNESLIEEKQKKTRLLTRKFFSKFFSTNFVDIDSDDLWAYSDFIDFSSLKEQEVESIIRDTTLNKVFDSDESSNKALILRLFILFLVLTKFFETCLQIEHYLIVFKLSTTIILRKSSKKNYSRVENYRSIALLSTMSKTLEIIIVKRINWIIETHDLLSRNHLKARKEISTKFAIHALIEKIHAVWAREQTCNLLCLDVSKTYDNVSHLWLLHNLRKRKIDDVIVDWVASFLRNRFIILRMFDYKINEFVIEIDIVQESRIFLILYLYYNVDLMNIENDVSLNAIDIDFVNDMIFMTKDDTTREIIKALTTLVIRAQKWASRHVFKFDVNKFHLIHFSFSNIEVTLDIVTLKLSSSIKELKSKSHCKYLRMIIDNRFHWNEHLNQMKIKAIKKLVCLSILAKSIWEINVKNLRRIYIFIVLSQFFYCCSIWYVLANEYDFKDRENKALRTM